MSLAIVNEIEEALILIHLGETMLHRTMLKSRHAPIELNNALMDLAKSKYSLVQAQLKEKASEDVYE